MPLVNLTLRNKIYSIACGEGQEKHLILLAESLNKRMDSLSKEMGKGGESLLLMMAALMAEDALQDAERQLEKLKQSQPSVEQLRKEIELKFSETANATLSKSINGVADYIEHIANKLEKA